MDRVRISVGMTLRPRCAECGRAVATFEVDGEQDRLCASCIEGYADTSILTLPQLIALHADEAITESENRALWGDK